MAYPSVPNTSDVARRLGVTRAAVSRWRSGSRLPQLERRQKIAEVFGWDIGAQAVAESQGRWAAAFNEVLAKIDAPV